MINGNCVATSLAVYMTVRLCLLVQFFFVLVSWASWSNVVYLYVQVPLVAYPPNNYSLFIPHPGSDIPNGVALS